MFSDLSDAALLHHLETLADRLGIQVRYENLADEEISVQSGGCQVSGKTLILVEIRRPPREQAQILARELSKCDLENLYLLPRVREFISLQAPPREKKRPQT